MLEEGWVMERGMVEPQISDCIADAWRVVSWRGKAWLLKVWCARMGVRGEAED